MPRSSAISPQPGKTLLARVREVARPLLICQQALAAAISQSFDRNQLHNLYRNRYCVVGHSAYTVEQLPSLISAAVIMRWAMAQLMNRGNASFVEADQWFQGDDESPLNQIPPDLLFTCLVTIQGIGDELFDVLPYSCEVFETGLEVVSSLGADRVRKKGSGVFYTPGDVADFVVSQIRSGGFVPATWFDPACGTGLLLLSALRSQISQRERFTWACRSLFGVDKSEIAAQSAVHIITASVYDSDLLQKDAETPYAICSLLGKNFAVADATTIDRSFLAHTLGVADGFDAVISNPPYVRSGEPNSNSSNLVPTFVQMLPRLTSDDGRGGMICPLSIAHSTRREYADLRRLMWFANEWNLFHFDRTPDSLFGDDVKTRNTIIVFKKSKTGCVRSSELRRWNSRVRSALFKSMATFGVPALFHSGPIPKCDSDFGYALLNSLYERYSEPLNRFLQHEVGLDSGYMLRVASTAYNWLPVSVETAATNRDPAYRYFGVAPAENVWGVFALLHSRLAYWLWRVWGDGFHLTETFVDSLPLGDVSLDRLNILGFQLWERMRHDTVTSTNSGVTRVSHSPNNCGDIIDEIDESLAAELGLAPNATRYLKEFVRRTLVADREDELESNHNLKKLGHYQKASNEGG